MLSVTLEVCIPPVGARTVDIGAFPVVQSQLCPSTKWVKKKVIWSEGDFLSKRRAEGNAFLQIGVHDKTKFDVSKCCFDYSSNVITVYTREREKITQLAMLRSCAGDKLLTALSSLYKSMLNRGCVFKDTALYSNVSLISSDAGGNVKVFRATNAGGFGQVVLKTASAENIYYAGNLKNEAWILQTVANANVVESYGIFHDIHSDMIALELAPQARLQKI